MIGNYFPVGYSHTEEEIRQFPSFTDDKTADIARAKELWLKLDTRMGLRPLWES
ncbi:MAG: hypothetical protein CM1200mP35_01590 [Chloroflexota bacterium]|nr:MAG: hypothetical protein CM1200mP35_01590 [Chloroflexota bacterium]